MYRVGEVTRQVVAKPGAHALPRSRHIRHAAIPERVIRSDDTVLLGPGDLDGRSNRYDETQRIVFLDHGYD